MNPDRSAERARLEPEGSEPPLWLRACPVELGADPVLSAATELFAEPAVGRALEANEAEEHYPAEVLERLRALGLAQLFTETGGNAPQATAFHQAAICLLAARQTTSLGITIGVNALALASAYLSATPEQLTAILERVRGGHFCGLLLTELEAGSNLRATQATATPEGAGYRISGEKQLINGGAEHDLLIALLRTCPAGAGPASHSLFWLERQAGVTALPRWPTLPARAADISGVRFDDLVLPVAQRLGDEGAGLEIVQKTLSISRGGISSLAVGTLTRARELALTYARKRRLYGAPIGELGAVADHLTRIDALWRVSTAASLRAMAWVNAAGLKAAPYTAVAKLVACDLAEEGVDEGRRVLGGRALLRALPYERLIRDVLLYGVFDGTSHLMLEDLQMRLSMQARRSGRASDLDDVRAVYAVPPRSLVEALRDESPTPRPTALVAHLSLLASLSGAVSLAPLHGAARALVALTNALKAKHLWGADQGLRHEMGRAYALIEALTGLVELCDPDRRSTLVARPLDPRPADALGYRHALGWLGSRVCEQLATRAAKADLPPDWLSEACPDLHQRGGLPALQRAFLAGHDPLRRELAQVLLA